MKTWTWEMLADEVHKGNIWEALEDVHADLQPLMALALSVAKWSPSMREQMYQGHRSLMFDQYCGLCMYWSNEVEQMNKKDFGVRDVCDSCPLFQAGYGCNENGSIWNDAVEMKDDHRKGTFNKHADALYNVLVELYAVEYYRMFPEDKV